MNDKLDPMNPLDACDLRLPWKRHTPRGHIPMGITPGVADGVHGNPLEDLVYLTECQLATVDDLAARPRFPKTQLVRHQRIAEFCIDACRLHGVTQRHTREAPLLATILGHPD